MKKLFAILLALMLLMVSTALAGDLTDYIEESDPSIATTGLSAPTATQVVTIAKAINAEVYASSTDKAPAQTITFTVGDGTVEKASTVTEAPAVTIDSLQLAEGATTGTININLPAYAGVGVYTYPVTENSNSVAGFKYATELELKVTVIQGESGLEIGGIAIRQEDVKTDEIENAYFAGALKLSKTVSGNMGDQNQDWNFTIVLTAPTDETVFSNLTVNSASTGTVKEASDGEAVTSIAAGTSGWTTKTLYVTLKHGQDIEIDNLPAGVTYSITETEANTNDYVTTPDGDSGTIEKAELAEASFENAKSIIPDTGIELDVLPYVMITVIALAAAALLVVRRRREEI